MPVKTSENGRLITLPGIKRFCAVGIFTMVLLIAHQFYHHRAQEFAISAKKHARYTEHLATMPTNLSAAKKPFQNISAQLHERLDFASRNTKVIVLWGWPNPYGRNISDKRQDWSCGSCVVTRQTYRIMEPTTSAVVFNFRSVKQGQMPPAYWRRPDHLYVWHTGESPAALIRGRYMTFEFEDNFKFNATMMVRRDADIVRSYGDAVTALRRARKRLADEYGGDLKNILKGKTRFAVTLTSNCLYAGAGLRTALLYRLRSVGMKLDGFGRCFNNKIPRTGNNKNDLTLLKKYKFYFAFENSYHCRDYITEKFFENGLALGVLPVVWGPRREDYEAIAPPHSFVHVEDFPSERELVNYLKYLDKNDTAYLEYFKWYLLKNEDMPTFGRSSGLCQLCRLLHGINVDDQFNTQNHEGNTQRPFFTDGVSPRMLPPMRKMIMEGESKDCFKVPDTAETERVAALLAESSAMYDPVAWWAENRGGQARSRSITAF